MSRKTFNDQNIKALLRLASEEEGADAQKLKESLCAVVKQNPEKVFSLLKSEFGAACPQTISGIIKEAQWQALEKSFCKFAGKSEFDLDLEEGLFLLSKSDRPELEFSELKEELDKITSDIKKAARHALDAGRIISIFSDVIFKFGGLRVSEQYSQNPQSYCLYDVLRRRIGSPALISSLYIIIGKRLDIPLCGVNMPGNFAVMLKTWNGGILIDVSHCGRIISPTECRAILISKKILWDEQFLKPLNNRQLLAQILCGLIGIYRRLEETIPQQHLKKMLAVL